MPLNLKNPEVERLAAEVWPRVPNEELGRRLTRAEEDEILGYGEHGV